MRFPLISNTVYVISFGQAHDLIEQSGKVDTSSDSYTAGQVVGYTITFAMALGSPQVYTRLSLGFATTECGQGVLGGLPGRCLMPAVKGVGAFFFGGVFGVIGQVGNMPGFLLSGGEGLINWSFDLPSESGTGSGC